MKAKQEKQEKQEKHHGREDEQKENRKLQELKNGYESKLMQLRKEKEHLSQGLS